MSLKKRWADVFQIYPGAIRFNPPQFYPSMSFLDFPVFFWSSSNVLSRYFDILVNSITVSSVLKLPKLRDLAPLRCTLYLKGLSHAILGNFV